MRVFPAIDIIKSGTRKEELLHTKDDLNRIWVLRKVLNPLSPVEAMELRIDKLNTTTSNAEFLAAMPRRGVKSLAGYGSGEASTGSDHMTKRMSGCGRR